MAAGRRPSRSIVKVNYLGVGHEVVVMPDMLDLDPTAVMTPLRDVPTLLRREKAPMRVTMMGSGFSTGLL